MSREIEEDQFAHYVKLDVKKIEAVHGLDQLVSQSQIKKERGQYVRQKYEALCSSFIHNNNTDQKC